MTILRQLRSQWIAFAFGLCCALSVQSAACGDDDEAPEETADAGKTDAGKDDAGKTDAGKDAGESSDCVKEPKTHLEIINACTDAEVVDKKPNLPLLLSDGGLPELPE